MIFGQNFRKFRKIAILVKFSPNLDFCQIFEKFRVCSKFRRISGKFRKISISVKFSKNFDLGQNFRKFAFLRKFRIISIWVNRKIRFWSHLILVKIFDLFENIEKLRFSQIFEKFKFCFKFSKKFDFRQNFSKFSICSKISKISILVKCSNNFDFDQNFRKFRKMSI